MAHTRLQSRRASDEIRKDASLRRGSQDEVAKRWSLLGVTDAGGASASSVGLYDRSRASLHNVAENADFDVPPPPVRSPSLHKTVSPRNTRGSKTTLLTFAPGLPSVPREASKGDASPTSSLPGSVGGAADAAAGPT